MRKILIWAGIGLVLLAAGVSVAPLRVYLSSQAIISRHYPLATPQVHADDTPETVARGAHLVRILGCADCHGADFAGRPLAGNPLPAPSLRVLPKTYTDKDIARALRFGLKGDGTSLWGMPSASYLYLRDADSDAILAYLRTLPRREGALPERSFDMDARRAMLAGTLVPSAEQSQSTLSPMDLGPRYEGGRYLARTACAECHGLDLSGNGTAPDLKAVGRYRLGDFFALMHDGITPRGTHAPAMTRLARARFSGFADYETAALYRYLYVRAFALPLARTPG